MGEKKPTTRTLPTGERATHYPDGRVVLQPTNSLGDLLGSQVPEQEAANVVLTDTLVQAALDKREAQASGDVVPSDKRSV
jgi:hypothetical protein